MVIQHQKKQKKIKKKKKIKLDTNEIVKVSRKTGKQKIVIKNFKILYESRKKLSNCLMIILKLYLKLNIKENMEEDSKH